MGGLIAFMLIIGFFYYVGRMFYTTFAPSEVAKRKERWGAVGTWLGGLGSGEQRRIAARPKAPRLRVVRAAAAGLEEGDRGLDLGTGDPVSHTVLHRADAWREVLGTVRETGRWKVTRS